MKLSYPYLPPDEKPITTSPEYFEARRQYEEPIHRLNRLRSEVIRLEKAGKKPNPKLLEEFYLLSSQGDIQLRIEFARRQPSILVARCPYCATPIWMRVAIFSLIDEFWYQESSNGREVGQESLCPHLFCIDGALSLNGRQPTEAHRPITIVLTDKITMAAEVPFVKPRVLNQPTMVAVVHDFPVAEKYTAYPIVYFTERRPSQKDFCIGWARTEYVDKDLDNWGKPTQATFIGKRSDAQDYELKKWVEWGKLFWLDPNDEEHPLVRGSVEAFPYGNISGRQHPYVIKDGQVQDLPDPVQSKAEYDLEL